LRSRHIATIQTAARDRECHGKNDSEDEPAAVEVDPYASSVFGMIATPHAIKRRSPATLRSCLLICSTEATTVAYPFNRWRGLHLPVV